MKGIVNGTGRLRKTLCRLAVLVFVCFLFRASPAADAGEQRPLFSFGLLADVQYADKETKGARHYRESLARLEQCVAELNRRPLAFTIELGDLIDGNETPETTLADLETVLGAYQKLHSPRYYVVGNHCLNAGKEVLRARLGLENFYYDFTAPGAGKYRFVVLDGNDTGYGILGETQLEWLSSRLTHASENGERVVIFCHFALLESAAPHHRMKEPEPVLELIDAAGCVLAYFAGHDHAGGYAERNGVHHVTVRGMVEAPQDGAFAVIEVYPARLMELGFGEEPSREMTLEVSHPPGREHEPVLDASP